MAPNVSKKRMLHCFMKNSVTHKLRSVGILCKKKKKLCALEGSVE